MQYRVQSVEIQGLNTVRVFCGNYLFSVQIRRVK